MHQARADAGEDEDYRTFQQIMDAVVDVVERQGVQYPASESSVLVGCWLSARPRRHQTSMSS